MGLGGFLLFLFFFCREGRVVGGGGGMGCRGAWIARRFPLLISVVDFPYVRTVN